MKIKEIRDLNVDELNQKGREMAEELFRLRLRHTTGQLDSTASLSRVRREIARIKTVQREKEVRT
jgi:large subunit ribosomal protein L29